MNLALIGKTLRDNRLLLLIVFVGVVVFEVLMCAVLQEFTEDTNLQWFQQPFFQRFFQLLLGSRVTADISATGLTAFGLSHPVMYALSWALIFTAGTGALVGEMDRGTADLVLTLPVSRTAVYVSVSIGLGMLIVPLVLATMAGLWLGEQWFPLWEARDFGRLGVLAVDLVALHLCVGGATLMLGALASRRGPAIAVGVGWVLASFLLEFLSQISETAERFAFLGMLHYYRPLPTISAGGWPVWDLVVLVGLAVVCWMIGWWYFRRRDVPAA